MEKATIALRFLVTAVIAPLVLFALYEVDIAVFAEYHKGFVDSLGFGLWRLFALAILGICVVWVAWRAIIPKKGDLVGLVVGFLLSLFLVISTGVFPVMYDFYLLPALLTCVYALALIVGIAGKFIA